MYRFRQILLYAILSTFVFYGCSKEESATEESKAVVKFTMNVDQYRDVSANNQPSTRAIGAHWSEGDEVGLFMKQAGKQLSEQSIISDYSNIQLVNNQNGRFAPVVGTLFYPSHTLVDFIAYYPYGAVSQDYKFHLDISNQSNMEDLDILYSKNAINQTSSVNPIQLRFERQLVMLKFIIKPKKGVLKSSDLTAKIEGLNNKATFNLVFGALEMERRDSDIAMNIESNNDGTVTATALVFPTSKIAEFLISIEFANGKKERFSVVAPKTYEKGELYRSTINSNVEIEDKPIVQKWFETPIITKGEGLVYIEHMVPSNNKIRNYSLLYDTKYKLAYWVAYPLHSSHMGDAGRTKNWRKDPELAADQQPNLSSSYVEALYDRGHQIASSDRNATAEMNQQTFYYTNSMPQVGTTFNQTTWNTVERQVQAWAKALNPDTLYVVSGAMIVSETDKQIKYTEDKSGNKIAIPKYCYKAIAKKRNGNYYTIGYKMDNRAYVTGENVDKYRVTVKELEEMTGFTFFPTIPEQAKKEIVESQWR